MDDDPFIVLHSDDDGEFLINFRLTLCICQEESGTASLFTSSIPSWIAVWQTVDEVFDKASRKGLHNSFAALHTNLGVKCWVNTAMITNVSRNPDGNASVINFSYGSSMRVKESVEEIRFKIEHGGENYDTQ